VYKAVTYGIEVSVEPEFLPDRSAPGDGRYFWAYHVNIANHSGETVQLQSRYWHITDGHGRVEEIRGAGVVGEQPVLKPGDQYRYTSGCPLATPSGIMLGRYQMLTELGKRFEVDIPAFSLDLPGEARSIN
jgi:ApaG protein